MKAHRLSAALCMLIAIVPGAARAQSVPPASTPDPRSGDFHTGYADGCMHATSGLPRNETRFKTNAAYHLGWTTGFSRCYDHQTINTNGDPNGPLKNIF
jgi:hypothetical protein